MCAGSHQFWASNKRVKSILEPGSFREVESSEVARKDRLTTPPGVQDLRDKIYALLDLVEDEGHEIPVDYSCSSTKLYARVLNSTLKHDARFAFNSVLAHDFECDLRLSLELPSHNDYVQAEGHNFLDWGWAL